MATPTVVFALSVLNLLLCVGGLLFVYFDWNAARRREYLYLYFTDEKPGQDYFSAARRRRTQYTRLSAAFGILSLRAFISVMVTASVSQPGDWDAWMLWWNNGTSTNNIQSATTMQPWLGFLESIGLALLGYSLLYEWKNRKNEVSNLPLLILAITSAVWGLLVLTYSAGFLGTKAWAIFYWATLISRLLLLPFLIWALRSRIQEKVPAGILVFPSSTITIALGVWLVVLTIGDFTHSPGAYALGLFIAFLLVVGSLARVTLNDYESMELSRHRLGRERGVIFSFLKRLGAAFTTDVEVDQILRIILESALETTEASAGAIYILDPKTNILEPRVVLNFFPPMYVEAASHSSERRTEELEEQMRHQSFAMGEGIIGQVGKEGRSQIVEDVRASGIMLGTTTEYMRNRSMLVVPLRVRDETLGVMAVLNKQRGSFAGDDESLLQALADQASLSINNAMLTVEVAEQERLRRDLQIARDIQQKLLPDSCPKIPGFEIAARGTSALEVGGDYYDFFWVDDDKLGIVVADVSGKGVYAALVVAMIRSAFRTQAPGNPDVRDVLSRVNTFISEDLRRDMFVTCVYGILEISTKKFSWARAGHEPLVVTHPEAPVEILMPDGFALGLIGAPDFQDLLEVKTIVLHPGDNLLMFTDGLTEAMNSDGEEFGMDRVLNSLTFPSQTADGEGKIFSEANGCRKPEVEEPAEMKTLEEAVQNHVGDAAQSDDLTIVFLAVK
jgi:sigma-B regulation protein RsbU (phosphoserine phosphatase)